MNHFKRQSDHRWFIMGFLCCLLFHLTEAPSSSVPWTCSPIRVKRRNTAPRWALWPILAFPALFWKVSTNASWRNPCCSRGEKPLTTVAPCLRPSFLRLPSGQLSLLIVPDRVCQLSAVRDVCISTIQCGSQSPEPWKTCNRTTDFICLFLFKFSAVNVAFMAYTPSGIYHLK